MTLPPFRNEPTLDFSIAAQQDAFRAGLARVRGRLGREYPLVIGGERVQTGEFFDSSNPSHPEQLVGRHAAGRREDVDRAVATASVAFRDWSRTPIEERAALLLRAAQAVRGQRAELAALMVFEVGKAWDEADGEVSEVVDLMEWYARQALELSSRDRMAPWPGELTQFRYLPLGVGVVISPWNFPLALATGMMAAAVVAGNCVILKPAATSSTCAAWLVQLFFNLGLPPGVINLLTGRGSVIGDALVDHPQVRFVAFTGSREVGIRIFERASRVHPGQLWLKRVQLEMGGKNAVVVDETADLELAAQAITASAFGFQGQKCSAGSRAVLVGPVYDRVLARVVELTSELGVGDPVDPTVVVGPVIDGSAEEKILDYLQVGRGEGDLLLGGGRVGGDGHLIEPTIFAGVDPQARIAQEEIFGPVLAVMRAADYEQALDIANGTDYGLAGSYFSRDPGRIAVAKERFHVGNLYINRRCTGAYMGVHPFGGFNMSGTDTKAGGPDYLLFFAQGQSIAERI
ncbi:MAG TPA: L-glutamate gamma-semialdehyde dehydrogenase [Candidatus Acidoferrales bacterium]|nr:L-glutamate gamma-semialdehyde dehydrogenase [Candidatus Acidoferrales bacterium]HVC38815.1 L-glutamate gamma-semialdehyde dehydrogenase [Candidatus Dormibacteraeota bacterium]